MNTRRFFVSVWMTIVVFALGLATGVQAVTLAQAGAVKAENDGEKVVITRDGEMVAQYIYQGHAKPIIYPVVGPHGARMTRDYPMKPGREGEATDHPHQQSLWFTHGDVNGISFWHLGDDAGRVVNDGGISLEANSSSDGPGRVAVTAKDKWVGPDGKTICTDNQRVTFHLLDDGELFIDYEITIHASEGEVVFGDTKEGTMGLRSHPALRLDGPVATGSAVNSEGVDGAAVWGKRAKWVDYWGEIDGNTVGFAIFDHPANLRHPTWWHARTYGLVAANPFGIHDFERKPDGTGDYTLPAGESVTFKYRFYFHRGDSKAAKTAERYAAFAGE